MTKFKYLIILFYSLQTVRSSSLTTTCLQQTSMVPMATEFVFKPKSLLHLVFVGCTTSTERRNGTKYKSYLP